MADSFKLTIRASIMLVTLIAVPLAAMFGKQLPELAMGWWRAQQQQSAWQTRPLAAGAAHDASNSAITAQQLAEQARRGDLTAAPPANASQGEIVLAPYQPPSFAGASSAAVEPRRLPNNPAQPLPPANFTALSETNPAARMAQPNAQTAVYSTPVISNAPSRGGNGTSSNDYLQAAGQRLRQLGAGYYRLETDGAAGERFRCVCQVPSPDGAAAQTFQAIRSDPLAAMHDVAQQVEAWRAAQPASLAQSPAAASPVAQLNPGTLNPGALNPGVLNPAATAAAQNAGRSLR